MCIADSMNTTKKKFKRSKMDMLRKERKCSIKTREGSKEWGKNNNKKEQRIRKSST